MDKFLNNKGLINARSGEPQNVNENSFLFSLENIFILRKRYSSIEFSEKTDQLKKSMVLYLMDEIRHEKDGKTLFRNVPKGDGLAEDQFLSRDQMIAYAIFSKLMGLSCHHEIYNHITSHFYTYDNVSGGTNFKRVVLPWDVIFLGILCDNKWSIRFRHVLYLKLWDTYKRGGQEETSGELLGWVQMETLKSLEVSGAKDWSSKYYKMMGERFNSASPFGKAFRIYFPEEGHPNREL